MGVWVERNRKGVKNALEVPRAYALGDAAVVEVVHQLDEARLRLLARHGAALDGADLVEGGVLLVGRGELVDVVEDVGFLVDAQGGSAWLG